MSSWEETLCRSRHLVSSGAFDKLFGDKYFIFDAIKVHLLYDVTLSLCYFLPQLGQFQSTTAVAKFRLLFNCSKTVTCIG